MGEACIVTFSGSRNYGTLLQAYALSEVLKSKGVDSVSLLESFDAYRYIMSDPVMAGARISNKLMGVRRRKFFRPVPYKVLRERDERLNQFRRDNYTSLRIDDANWDDVIARGTVFIAGGDIIWQPAMGYPSRYFLDFAVCAGLPCFSYGSSFGAQHLPRRYYNGYRRYLQKYAAVGVREEAGVRLLDGVIDSQVVKQVLDPTLLAEMSLWDSFADNAEISVELSSQGYVLCYFVMDDPRYWEFAAKVGEDTGLQVIALPMHNSDEDKPFGMVLDGTPYEFVWLIKHATIVLTDSFHACCFSMLYEREFYLMRRTRLDEDDKFNDFLRKYSLEDRAIASEATFEQKGIPGYTHAREILTDERMKSHAFLEAALEATGLL